LVIQANVHWFLGFQWSQLFVGCNELDSTARLAFFVIHLHVKLCTAWYCYIAILSVCLSSDCGIILCQNGSSSSSYLFSDNNIITTISQK